MHIHVFGPNGEAKFWIEPTVSLGHYKGFADVELRRLQIVVEDKKNEIIKAWKKHFKN